MNRTLVTRSFQFGYGNPARRYCNTGRVPSVPPSGEPAPADGSLPPSALTGLGTRPFGVYVHVPFCATRCGYCDFNTYTATDLGLSGSLSGSHDPASPASWLEGLRRELDLAASVLGTAPRADTVFLGGGTPSLLGPSGLTAVLDAVRASFGLAPGAEVTTEANPESTTPSLLAAVADAGYTRLSLGMQSDVDHVLAVLDRRHTPGAAVSVARSALAAYGQGRHEAGLTFGDCIVVGLARQRDATILFKGDGFALTDVRPAWPPDGGGTA